ncbi:hypothetical protein [Bradyrhizobium sp. S69]|uniref:hypothetical protein n=1 Tax=Bradyrhizobium sp. S69 TaxID=1641856 RepID=UPI00131DDDAD|nr:hypothetical protein [Bradyrhizobium sp. S69]
MPHRTAKFAPAIIASLLLAGVRLATASPAAAQAVDSCLASPKDQAPQGSHWYYRIEHPSNRHCWYLRGQHDAATPIAPNASVDASPSADPASLNPSPPNNSMTMPGSIANAHAELTSPQAGGDQRSITASGQSPAPAAGADATAGASRADANMLRSVVASRWPEQLAAASSTAPDANADTSSAVTSSALAPSSAKATAPSAATVVPLAAADAVGEKQSGSTQMLIIAIVGALSVAGLAASAVGYGGRRKLRLDDIEVEAENRGERRAIWETTLADRPLPSPFAASAAIRPNIGIPRELREAQDPDHKIAEMLARLAKSAQA